MKKHFKEKQLLRWIKKPTNVTGGHHLVPLQRVCDCSDYSPQIVLCMPSVTQFAWPEWANGDEA